MNGRRCMFALIIGLILLLPSMARSAEADISTRWDAVNKIRHLNGKMSLDYWESAEFKAFHALGDQALSFLESVYSQSEDPLERALALHLYGAIGEDPVKTWDLFQSHRRENDSVTEATVISLLQYSGGAGFVRFCKDRLLSGPELVRTEALSAMAWRNEFVPWQEMYSYFFTSGDPWTLVVIGELGDAGAIPVLRELSTSQDSAICAASLFGRALLRDSVALDRIYQDFSAQRSRAYYGDWRVAGAIIEGIRTKSLVERILRDAQNSSPCLATLTRIREQATGQPISNFSRLERYYYENPSSAKVVLGQLQEWWKQASVNWEASSDRIVVERHRIPPIGHPPEGFLWIDYYENE